MDVKESIVSAGIEPILGHFDHFVLVELVAAAGGLHDTGGESQLMQHIMHCRTAELHVQMVLQEAERARQIHNHFWPK